MHDTVHAITHVGVLESRRAPDHRRPHRLPLMISGSSASRPNPKVATRSKSPAPHAYRISTWHRRAKIGGYGTGASFNLSPMMPRSWQSES